MTSELLKFSCPSELKHPSLIVGWSIDASSLGAKVIDYLNRKLGGQTFCEIEPLEFFPLGGVSVESDLVQFPESKFYTCPRYDLLLFKSALPNYDWYKFLNLLLDVTQNHCQGNEIYTVGGMISLAPHTSPRELVCTFNSPEFKMALEKYNLAGGLDYETPPNQRPTLNSFLLWTAKRRNIPGVSLWVPIPFYLVAVDDPRAEKRILEFFDQRFELGLDLSDLDEEIKKQNQLIAEVRSGSREIDEAIKKLESNLSLSPEENQKLVQEIERILKGKEG